MRRLRGACGARRRPGAAADRVALRACESGDPVTNLLGVLRPLGGFRTVVMDPPWKTELWGGPGLPQRAKAQHYGMMSIGELEALPVAQMMARDAVLIMWTIDSHTDQAIDLGKSYGLTFKTAPLFIWDKGRMSFGKWSRKEAEICLLFSKGKPSPRPGSRGVRQIIREKPREHSRKPDEFYRRVERLCFGPYLDIFGRGGGGDGWSEWGHEAGRFKTETPASCETGALAAP